MDPYEHNSVMREPFGKGVLVRVAGEWDFAIADLLGIALAHIESGRDVIVDLRETSFYKRVRCGGSAFETISSGAVRRLLQVTALDRLLEMSPDRRRRFESRIPGAQPDGTYDATNAALEVSYS